MSRSAALATGQIGEYTLRIGVGGEQDAQSVQYLRSWIISRVFLRTELKDAAVGWD